MSIRPIVNFGIIPQPQRMARVRSYDTEGTWIPYKKRDGGTGYKKKSGNSWQYRSSKPGRRKSSKAPARKTQKRDRFQEGLKKLRSQKLPKAANKIVGDVKTLLGRNEDYSQMHSQKIESRIMEIEFYMDKLRDHLKYPEAAKVRRMLYDRIGPALKAKRQARMSLYRMARRSKSRRMSLNKPVCVSPGGWTFY